MYRRNRLHVTTDDILGVALEDLLDVVKQKAWSKIVQNPLLLPRFCFASKAVLNLDVNAVLALPISLDLLNNVHHDLRPTASRANRQLRQGLCQTSEATTHLDTVVNVQALDLLRESLWEHCLTSYQAPFLLSLYNFSPKSLFGAF